MDNNNTGNQISNKSEYQTLGKKVFWLFFLQTSPAAFIFLLISIITFVISFQSFVTSSMQKYALIATLITFILALISAAISLVIAWMTFTNYVFSMAEDSFKIKRGIFNKTENAIPYRQIQNVDIERGVAFQLIGLSRLIILTAGHEDENSKAGDEAEGIIPAIDQKLAELLQIELLKRADIQKITETK